ncbi:hypothetical protein ABWI01_03540 [Oceanicaulis alexandrii]|uniref:hypothetical protein n=1 Tax=Oceanicaulis alexandrii TaxID=153233 RepID=UPI0035CE9C9C
MSLPKYALSVRQPWAWAILYAGKDIENRSVASARGMRNERIAVHAAKGMTQWEYKTARDLMATLGIITPPPARLIRGAIVGTVDVTGQTYEGVSPWFFGPVGLRLEDPEPLQKPIPAKGALGYFLWRAAGELDPPRPWMIRKGAAS